MTGGGGMRSPASGAGFPKPEATRRCCASAPGCSAIATATTRPPPPTSRLIELCPDWIDWISPSERRAGGGGSRRRGDRAGGNRRDAGAGQHRIRAACGRAAGGSAARRGSGRLGEARGRGGAGGGGAGRGEPGGVIDAAEVLMRCGRAEEAATLLRREAAGAATPRLWRVLSGAEMLCGRLEGALDAAERARRAEPDNPEFALHHGHLLWHRGDMSEAAVALAGAARLDPDGRDIKRTQLSFYLAAGLTTEATVAGGELLHRFPEDTDAAEAVLHLLNHRLDTIDGQYVVLGERVARAPRPPRPQPGLLERLRGQRRVVRRADHPRNPDAVRRHAARLRLGADRADAAHRAAVGDVRRADARNAADRRGFPRLLLHRADPVSRVRPFQRRDEPCADQQRAAAAAAAGVEFRCHRRARRSSRW